MVCVAINSNVVNVVDNKCYNYTHWNEKHLLPKLLPLGYNQLTVSKTMKTNDRHVRRACSQYMSEPHPFSSLPGV